MHLSFEFNGEIYRLHIQEAVSCLEGDIGYRSGDNILLKKSIFKEFIEACKADDFPYMKRIIDHCVDLDAQKKIQQPGKVIWNPKPEAMKLLTWSSL